MAGSSPEDGFHFMDTMGNNEAKAYTIFNGDEFAYKLSFSNVESNNSSFVITYLAGKTTGYSGTHQYTYLLYGGDRGDSKTMHHVPNVSKTFNPPETTYAFSTIAFSGTSYTGDYTMKSATFNGGVTIDGSLNYLGEDCMVLRGSRIGKTDGSSHICSDGCVEIYGNVKVYGTITAKGNVYINSGTVYGDVYSGGDVYITPWRGYIKKNNGNYGNLFVKGTTDATSLSVEGEINEISYVPDSCTNYSLPDHQVISPAQKDPDYSRKTFYGTSIDDVTTYAFTDLSTNGGAKTCFDLSTPGTYINIFVSGNLDFESSIYIKTDSKTSCYDSSNLISSSNYTDTKFLGAAKRIYMDVNGDSKFAGNGHAWVGTLFSNGTINSQGGFVSVGALYSNNSINLSGGSYSYFVISDYVKTFWKK